MKCKICKTERDDLTGDICVDCLADELSKIFVRSPHGNNTINNPVVCSDPSASARHTIEDLKADMVRLKVDVARLRADMAVVG